MKIREAFQSLQSELLPIYGKHEASSLAKIAFEDYLGITQLQIIQSLDKELEGNQSSRLSEIKERLLKHEPIQHITGFGHFYGMNLKVNEYVLIPRSETEELVDKVIKEVQEPKMILDIGTGSACIALALKKHFADAELHAVDISKEALEVAKSNAESTSLQLNLMQRDILSWRDYSWSTFDLIVSNPPYVSTEDKLQMQKNVLDYEPHLALFSEDDPLLFYKVIFDFASVNLRDSGTLYFELNESFAQETARVGEERGFEVEISSDLQDKERFLKAQKKGCMKHTTF